MDNFGLRGIGFDLVNDMRFRCDFWRSKQRFLYVFVPALFAQIDSDLLIVSFAIAMV